jgi:hypothetical protein
LAFLMETKEWVKRCFYPYITLAFRQEHKLCGQYSLAAPLPC